MRNNSWIANIVILAFVLIARPVFAASGVIDPMDKNAWSENGGWLNFNATQSNITVTDSFLTGYVWGENYGWIRLDAPNGGVTNTCSGVLGGHAWGEHTGWISFSGVTIDANGYFNGLANSTITGLINMNCANTNSCAQSDFKVRTSWRPCAPPPPPPPTGGGGGGGGGPYIPYVPTPPTPPPVVTPPPVIEPIVDSCVTRNIPTFNVCPDYLLQYIKLGEQNDVAEVRKLQDFLRTYEGFTTLRSTGTYGNESFEAVKAFQAKYSTDVLNPWTDLGAPSGWVYQTTKKKINELYCEYTKAQRLASATLQAEAACRVVEEPKPVPPPVEVIPPLVVPSVDVAGIKNQIFAMCPKKTADALLACPTYLLKYIKLGVRNDAVEVRKLQEFLRKYEGFAQLVTTGIYGTDSFNAVKAFQVKYAAEVLTPWGMGTTPTGWVYRTTTKKINELYCGYSEAERMTAALATAQTACKPQPETCGPYLFKYIKYGEKNDIVEVKKLQTFLKAYEGFGDLQVTGLYDLPSLDAVYKFQEKYTGEVLSPWRLSTARGTGYVYQTTLKKINELYCQYKTGTRAPAPGSQP